MRIAVLGPGAIGSTFAYRLARGGHDVTVIARGQRLAWLTNERAIVSGSGDRAEVKVAEQLDPAVPWDLVLVTVLAPQVAAVLPALKESSARKVMFMFNTFESIEPLRDAVGAERFVFGFPAGVFTLLVDGRIHPQIRSGTVSGEAEWAKVFTDAGIPTAVESDMQSWLRSHAALVAPLMSIGTMAFARSGGITWGEAAIQARGFRAGLDAVRAVGSSVRPPVFATLASLPGPLLTGILWLLSRTRMIRDLGSLGANEPRMLLDMMRSAAPALSAPLEAIRP